MPPRALIAAFALQLALDACNIYWLDIDQMSSLPRLMAIAK
jgi:hypothetical protein